jgi:hypothetical protein
MTATFGTADHGMRELAEEDISWIEDQPNGTVLVQTRSELKPVLLLGTTASIYATFEAAAYPVTCPCPHPHCTCSPESRKRHSGLRPNRP